MGLYWLNGHGVGTHPRDVYIRAKEMPSLTGFCSQKSTFTSILSPAPVVQIRFSHPLLANAMLHVAEGMLSKSEEKLRNTGGVLQTDG